jgi:methyltransferase (TIGR00027 family)
LTKIQDVTGTAFIVAEFRAQANAEAHPLYRDPIVPLFLNDRTRQAAERIAAGFPPGEKGVKLRTRYFDDHLDAQLGNDCRQVVILGAGLDTRGVRKQVPGVTYFEIDDADTISFKQARLAEAGIEGPIVFIAGNYVTDGLLQLLDANGFDFDLPTYVIWEGNTMYLDRPAVLKVLTDLRSSVGEFAISFDYLTETVIDYATGDEQTTAFVRRFAEMGATWRFGIDDLGELAGDAGVIVRDKIKTADLYRTFWPGQPLDSIWFDHYSLCTLAPGEGISL